MEDDILLKVVSQNLISYIKLINDLKTAHNINHYEFKKRLIEILRNNLTNEEIDSFVVLFK